MTLIDARGVEIAAGDTVIYGFGVDRSVAMAEGVVLGGVSECTCRNDYGDHETKAQRLACPRPTRGVSLTPMGRVRVRVVRRSYNSGVKPVVDVAPDRLVVLKPIDGPGTTPALPGSPLPTQDDEARIKIEKGIKHHLDGLKAKMAPDWWERPGFPVAPLDAEAIALAEYVAYHYRELAAERRKLKALYGI